MLKFAVDEKILAYSSFDGHGLMLHNAKIIEVDESKENPYLVHYVGWAKKW